MHTCQKHLFQLPNDITYLNCAYQSPLMKSLEAIGHQAVSKKLLPHLYTTDDFFKPVEKLKQTFARLIHAADFERIAVIPSVSYGMATVAHNVSLQAHQNVVIAAEQFPSNVYPWMRLCGEAKAELRIVSPPDTFEKRGEKWNEKILQAIDAHTHLVAIGNVHWADGTLFDLMAIRQKTRACGALLVIDGTQSVGALPIDVQTLQPDALVCAGYKWLLGPYNLGLAFYGEYFDEGRPLEENWYNRVGSDQFQGLADYQERYRPKAYKYSVGEQSSFIHLPMLTAALEQLLAWEVPTIQAYCRDITHEAILTLQQMGCVIEEERYRTHHLWGIRLPDAQYFAPLQQALAQHQIYVSYRGDAIRVAPHVYNDTQDLQKMVSQFQKVLGG